MSKVIETIKNRRTTRKFEDTPVSREALEQIVEAGVWAPSGANMQPWHFTVIQDRQLMDRLNDASREAALTSELEYVRNRAKASRADIFYGATSMVIVSVDETALTPLMDISAATQNMLLAAEELNLGACWNGMITMLFDLMPDHEVMSDLKIPEGMKPSHAVVIGHRGHEGKAPQRKEGVVQFL